MAVNDDYFVYPHRRPGMDHDYYDTSNFQKRKPFELPGGAKVALWIVPILEFFPFNMESQIFPVPGGLTRPYPDYWNYTLRDYGNRVGIWRIIRGLEERKLKASFAMNSRVAERYPDLATAAVSRQWELIAHGVDMNHIHGNHMSEEEERALVKQSISSLEEISNSKISGWLSPANAISDNTTDLGAEAGLDYTCDWISDELPFNMTTRYGDIHSMPLGYELSDVRLVHGYNQRGNEYAEQIVDAFNFLYREADTGGGRVLALPLHPWIVGAPHRISSLLGAIDHIISHDGVWSATGKEILNVWKAQQ